MRGKWNIAAAILLSLSLLVPAGGAVMGAGAESGPRAEFRYATRSDTSPSLRDIRPLPSVLGEIFEARPPKQLPNRAGSTGTSGPDPVLQSPTAEPSTLTVGAGFEGIPNVDGVLPPDTVGDVGPDHYVQMVNLSYAVFDRAGNRLLGPLDNSTLWAGLGGPCESSNDGDPIVMYDHLADRWILTQFALPRFPRGPFYQCLAVSTSGDPTGSYYRYEFKISDDKLNDYPKLGVWPDGYYMAVNQFKCNFIGCSWGGQGVVAFEREKMLNGQAARMVYFDLYNTDPNLGGMLPSDLDGPAPPAGTPNYFVQVDDDAWGYSPDQLQMWKFSVNWASSAASFTPGVNLAAAAFDTNMCGYARNCIPQPGGYALDAISDRLMYRLQYRNFGSHETLVVNHTVDVNGTDRAGIRWYELRNSGSGWGIHQQSTFSPDSTDRWMASLAVNGAGDMALGYSISGTGKSPSIRVTGRLSGDALGDMTRGETEVKTGSGYQEHSSGRWGDYSAMTVDPADDCTFWFTTEYYATVGTAPWQTYIVPFKLQDCGPANQAPAVDIVSPDGSTELSGTVTIQVSASDPEGDAISAVEWRVDEGGWQAATLNSGTGYYEAAWDTTTAGNGSHTIYARATDAGGKTGTDSQAVTVSNPVAEPDSMHVHDLDGTSTSTRSTWRATVTITVYDKNEEPASGATVRGTWSEGATGTASCTTDSNGQCTVNRTGIAKKTGSVRFTVDDVSGSLVYDGTANHDPDGDSDGTSIVVLKP